MQLEVRGLTKMYPGRRGLLPVSFDVQPGELIALVGHNGAGKSTLLKMLANWLIPDAGHATVDGLPLRHRREMVRKVGFVPETPNLYDQFSVDYNLALFARLVGGVGARIDDTMREFNLMPFRRAAVRTLSKGLKQRLSIGRALLANPSVLLLDEPTAALDAEMTAEVHRLIHRVHGQGKTVLFTSHRAEEVDALATRVLVLRQGALVFDGTPTDYAASSFGMGHAL